MPRSCAEADLVRDRHALQSLDAAQHFWPRHVRAVEGERVVEFQSGALHVVQRNIGILGDFDQGRERVQVPQGEHIVAVARQFIEEGVPEIEAPHFRDVLLSCVAGIRVARGAYVERDVELDAALGDVGHVVGIAQRVQRIEPCGFGEVQPAVHGAGRV
jgi:hypothetical protein